MSENEKILYRKYEVKVKFMNPGTCLAGDTYDEKGHKIKSANEMFTKSDIDFLKSKGIEKLYYEKEQVRVEKTIEENNQIKQISTSLPKKSNDHKHVPVFLSDIHRRPGLLVCNLSNEKYDFFMPRIIANGISLYRLDEEDQIEIVLKRYRITHLIVDIDFDGYKWLHLINKLNHENNSFHIIIIYGNPQSEIYSNFHAKTVITSSFDKNMPQKDLVKKTIEKINETDPYYSERSHLKVLINEIDNIKIDVYISQSLIIGGIGYVISPLELTFSLIKDVLGEMYNFSVGDHLDRIGITIFGKIILAQAEVTSLDRENKRITIRFTHRSESLLVGIGKIITGKLNDLA